MPSVRVALESTVLAHGLPSPSNQELAWDLNRIVRGNGADPVTIGYVDGSLRIGLTESEIELMCSGNAVEKVSIRDIPRVIARSLNGATTVATTIRAAHAAGIRVMATGGIGGVHRNADGHPSSDVSADLAQLAVTPLTVVCSGPKAILHLYATREKLETLGVCIAGYQTDTLPAFYCDSTPFSVDVRCDTPSQIADLARARDAAGMSQAILVVNPLPAESHISLQEVDDIVSRALSDPTAASLKPAEVTPYLLSAVRDTIGDAALAANIELLKRNAELAARIAVELGQERNLPFASFEPLG